MSRDNERENQDEIEGGEVGKTERAMASDSTGPRRETPGADDASASAPDVARDAEPHRESPPHSDAVREDVTADTAAEERIAEMLEHSIDLAAFVPAVGSLDPADAADFLEQLEADEAAEVVHEIADEISADHLAEMAPRFAILVLQDLEIEYGIEEPAKYLDRMDPDDAVDILQACPEDFCDRLIAALPPEKAVLLEQLSSYDPETAGGMMTTDFIRMPADTTIGRAVELVRDHTETDYNEIFCVDRAKKLVGSLSIRKLLFSRPDQRVEDVMEREVDFLVPETDREEVAEAFERYDFAVLPVVDHSHRLLGVITVDDVLDAIQEEHTEDQFKMVGAGKGEAVISGVYDKFRGRFPWLIVNLFTSFTAAIVVLQFEQLIGRLAILAVLMPVIANQAGNAGQQSLAVTLRGLVLGEVHTRRVWPLVWREFILGVITGALIGSIVGIGIGLFAILVPWSETPAGLGAVFAIAMTGSMSVGCFVGSAMPVMIERLKFDPATASTIFLTMVTDTISFLTFLGLALALEGMLLGGR